MVALDVMESHVPATQEEGVGSLVGSLDAIALRM